MQLTSLKIISAWLLTLAMGSYIGATLLFFISEEVIYENLPEYFFYFLRGMVLGSFLLPTLICLIVVCESSRDKTYETLMPKLNQAHIICVLVSIVVGIMLMADHGGDFFGLLFVIALLIAGIYSGFASIAWRIVFRKERDDCKSR